MGNTCEGERGKLKAFYGEEYKTIVREILQNLLNAKWMSSGLDENNAFTTTLVLRCYGFLRESPELAPFTEQLPSKMWSIPEAPSKSAKSEAPRSDPKPGASAPTPLTLEEIAQALAGDIQNFSINKYPPASAVVYWFLDGVDRAKPHNLSLFLAAPVSCMKELFSTTRARSRKRRIVWQ
jgi:hypothetical protein